jgi:hypothetical protein
MEMEMEMEMRKFPISFYEGYVCNFLFVHTEQKCTLCLMIWKEQEQEQEQGQEQEQELVDFPA